MSPVLPRYASKATLLPCCASKATMLAFGTGGGA
jgi:hypothetical protein